MPTTRYFLGWGEPLVVTGSAWLIGAAAAAGTCDLTDYLVVVPNERARRRLLERLVAVAEARSLSLVPPQIVTPGGLYAELVPPQVAVADDLTALVARVHALRTAPAEQIRSLLRCPPESEDWAGWFALGIELQGIHSELSGGGLIAAQVAACCRSLSGEYCDAASWEALSALHTGYLSTLDTIGRQDALEERCRLVLEYETLTASEASSEPSETRHLVLLGTPDLNAQTVRLLSGRSLRVTALIAAPESEAEGFDPLGCLCPRYWAVRPLCVAPDQWVIADRPRDQAAAVVEALAQWSGESGSDPVSPGEVVIGLGDATLAPWVERVLIAAGIRSRVAAGRMAAYSEPALLLAAMAEYLQQSDRSQWAALVRHPDLEAWLADSLSERDHTDAECLLSRLDSYVEACLPGRLGEAWVERKETSLLRAAWELLEELLQPLRREPRLLPEWSEPFTGVLRAVYGARILDPNRFEEAALADALAAVAEVLRAQADLPLAISPLMDAAAALQFTGQRLEDTMLPHPPDAGAVELVGWLELPSDDARTVVLTGLNDGLIPEAVNGDALLPNRLRRALGLVDNERRYARDAVALSGLLGGALSGRTRLRLISGRHGDQGEPLAPSRLLLADLPALAERIRKFYPPAEATASAPSRLLLRAGKVLRLEVPYPKPTPCLHRLAVTGFRDYLACPYRFYLRHVLGLESPDDTQPELDGGLFGTLAHETLSRCGRNGGLAGEVPDAIASALGDTLSEVAGSRLGNRVSPLVNLQLRHLRRRLKRFAAWQAEQTGAGWETVYREQSLETQLLVDGQPFTVRARIDRIDLHPDRGWRVIDYKTGDGMTTPEAAHRTAREGRKVWVDLQLPLYRRLVAELGIPSDGLGLAYVLLPKAPVPDPFRAARWEPAELEEAGQVAAAVIRKIRAGCFWPPAAEPPTYPDGFGAICQDRCPPNRRRFAVAPGNSPRPDDLTRAGDRSRPGVPIITPSAAAPEIP